MENGIRFFVYLSSRHRAVPRHRLRFRLLPHWNPNDAHDHSIKIYVHDMHVHQRTNPRGILEMRPLENIPSPLASLLQTFIPSATVPLSTLADGITPPPEFKVRPLQILGLGVLAQSDPQLIIVGMLLMIRIIYNIRTMERRLFLPRVPQVIS